MKSLQFCVVLFGVCGLDLVLLLLALSWVKSATFSCVFLLLTFVMLLIFYFTALSSGAAVLGVKSSNAQIFPTPVWRTLYETAVSRLRWLHD
jgi:hypothetical protein